ncbi:MAG: carboxypeptidase-like regulatory domain-containing protein [Acidobacteriota bacterium]|nr:carboxypeptidase-like regulatory domain-containing protein [Acidobacteriota bacterium]
MTTVCRPLAACLLSMMCADAAFAQVVAPRDALPTGQQQPPPVGTAEISGTVLMAGGTQPARKTRVSLSGVELRGGRSATTDDSGRFSFTALPAGRYSLTANRPGHVSVTYGQRQPGRPGTQISLSDGQKFGADIQIPKGSVITGTVLDENGEPAPQTSVRVMRVVMSNGERTLSTSNAASTDDRGIYRAFGLMPGEYVVCATPRNPNTTDFGRMEAMEQEMRALQTAAAQVSAEQTQAIRDRIVSIQGSMPAGDVEAPPGYAPICYPGTIAASSATPIPLGISEERGAVDFQLQLAPLARIEGVVINSTGAPLTQTSVSLRDASSLGGSTLNMEARPDGEGRFRLQSVPPGQYRLTARSAIAPPRPGPGQQETSVGRGRGAAPPAAAVSARPQPITVWAAADVSVDGRTLSNVVLSLQLGVNVSGQVTFEGAQPPPTDLTRIRVNMSPVGQTPFGGATSAQVDAAGRFSLQGVPPGRYRLSATGAGGWTTESAVMGGQDTLDFPFEVKGNQNLQGVTITMTDRRTELNGKVLDGQNQPAVDYTIVIFPADHRYWAGGSRRIQTTRPSTDGSFTFRNLPPGDYRIATPIDLEPAGLSDPAVLQQLEGASMRVTLQPGETKVQNIRLGQGG